MDLIPLNNNLTNIAHNKDVNNAEQVEKEEFTDDPVKDILYLTNILKQDSRKWEITLDKITDCRDYLKELCKKDLNLVDYFEDLGSNNGRTLSPDSFKTNMNSLKSESIIIYSQNADLYRVYEPDELEKFINNLSTHYSRPDKNGPMYEVIRDNFPQKLIIVVNDIIEKNIQLFKELIMAFFKKYIKINKFAKDDCMIYKDNTDKTTKFIFKNIPLKNDNDRRSILRHLKTFIIDKKYINLANKIEFEPPPFLIDGAKLYTLPTNMVPVGIAPQKIEESLKYMINIANSTDAKYVNFNVSYFIQNITNNSNNINSGNFINNDITINDNCSNNDLSYNDLNNNDNDDLNDRKTLKKFFKYIYDNKPKWFKEGQLINMSIIEKEYNNYFGGITPRNIISRNLNQKLFTNGERTNKSVNKRLVSFNELKALFT